MPPTILGLTQGLNLYGQLTNGTTLRPSVTDQLVFSGPLYDDAVIGFNDSTHLFGAGNVHRCSTSHVNNAKYLTSNTAAVNGTVITLPISKPSCTLLLEFFSLEKVLVASPKFYVYQSVDTTSVPNVTFYAAEGATSTAWQNVNSLSNALVLTAPGTADTEVDFYVACSMSPLAVGAQTGTLKLSLSYV